MSMIHVIRQHHSQNILHFYLIKFLWERNTCVILPFPKKKK